MRMRRFVILIYEDCDAIKTKEVQNWKNNGCACRWMRRLPWQIQNNFNDLVVRIHAMGAVNDELLLYT